MIFSIETEREQDGRWIAEITDIPERWLTAIQKPRQKRMPKP